CFDVTDKLLPNAPNLLIVRLRSAKIEAAGKDYDPANTNAFPPNQEGIWIRKQPHCGGYDILPRFQSAGLWRPVELILHVQHEIRDMYFATLSAGETSAELAISFELKTDLALLPELSLRLQGECGGATF